MQAGTGSLLANADLLTKVAFPKIVAADRRAASRVHRPRSSAMFLATVVAVASGRDLSRRSASVVGLPLGLVMLVLAVAGPAFFLSASLVKYRDASTLVAFALQLLLFVSPVAYPPEFVPEGVAHAPVPQPPRRRARPAACGARWHRPADRPQLLLSGGVGRPRLVVGMLHFRRSEREFADII